MKDMILSREGAEALANRFGTPLYIYDAEVLAERATELVAAFAGGQVHFAVKANPNPALLKILKKLALGAEAVSPGELLIARRAGFPKELVSFTGPSLTEADLGFAASHAGRVHLDSLRQLETWGRQGLGREVSLRVNLGIGAGHHEKVSTGGDGSKFGITRNDLPEAMRIAGHHSLIITSLQQHIGSHVPDGSDYLMGASTLLEEAERFPEVRHIDFGGGFGVPYEEGEGRLDLAHIGEELRRMIGDWTERAGRELSWSVEPGRYVVAEAGMLMVRVTDRKETGAHLFVGVDSGFNHLVRPALYGSYHAIENLSRAEGERKAVSLAGNLCESGDVLAWDREMLVPEVGDLLAIRTTGAYGMSMASQYNLRALPKEVLLTDRKASDISYDRSPYLIRP